MKKQQRGSGLKARKGNQAPQPPAEPSPLQLLAAVDEAHRLQPGETDGCSAAMDRFSEALRRVEAIPVTLTLKEICSVIGDSVEPHRFAFTAFDSLAGEIEAVAGINGNDSDAEVWRPLLSIAQRARLASKVERQLSA